MIGVEKPPCDAGVVRGTHGAARAPRKRLALAATVLGSSMAFIDATVVNVALPAIQKGLNAGPAAAQWTMNAYLLALSALVLVGGAAGDLYGRKRMFVLGIGLFTLASLACALAPTAAVLIAARAVQGVGAAMLTPSSLAILGAVFGDKERGAAIGAWAGFGAVTTALGPVVGGWLVDALSWRAIFLLNVPIAAGALWLTFAAVPESKDPDARRLDFKGAFTVALGLGALTWGLTAGPQRGWGDGAVLAALSIAAAGLVAFLVLEAREAQPMMPLGLFRSRPFSGANGLTFLLYFALSGALFYLPFELIRVEHYSATEAGAAFLPLSIAMGGLSSAAGKLADRIGPRWPLTIGPILAGTGFAILGLSPPGQPYWTGVLPGLAVLAAGMTASVAPLTALVMGSVEPRHTGLASGVNNAVARVGGLLAIAALGVLFAWTFSAGWRGGGAHEALAAAMAGRGSPEGLAALHGAYRTVMLAAAVCAAGAGVVAFLTIPAKAPVQRQA